MPDLRLSSSISGTKVFPKFLLPIEEFTLNQRRRLEGASQLHFTHSWDHAGGVCLLQCSEVVFSFPYCIPSHSSCYEGKADGPTHFPSWACCEAVLRMLLHSQSLSPVEPGETEKIFLKILMQHLPIWGVETQSQFLKDWEVRNWRKAPLL